MVEDHGLKCWSLSRWTYVSRLVQKQFFCSVAQDSPEVERNRQNVWLESLDGSTIWYVFYLTHIILYIYISILKKGSAKMSKIPSPKCRRRSDPRRKSHRRRRIRSGQLRRWVNWRSKRGFFFVGRDRYTANKGTLTIYIYNHTYVYIYIWLYGVIWLYWFLYIQ